MTVETINRLIFGASLLSAVFALTIVWLNRYKNELVAAQSAQQQKTIEQLRAQTTTIRSCQVSLSIVASKAAHVMNAEVAPLFPGHALALAIDETAIIRFANGEGNIVDAPDGSIRELRVSYRLPDEATFIGQQLESLAAFRVLAIDVSDLIGVANLREDRPVTVSWTLRANNVVVAGGEWRFDNTEQLARGEVRLDVHEELARVPKRYESSSWAPVGPAQRPAQ